jgi:hypothetical protein
MKIFAAFTFEEKHARKLCFAAKSRLLNKKVENIAKTIRHLKKSEQVFRSPLLFKWQL